MMTAKLSFAACLVAFSLVACAANTDSTESTPTDDTSSDITAAHCKGLLPNICEVCADGTSECAHWVVKNKKCEIAICPAPPVCVEREICAINSHFDTTACKCVPNLCVQNELCAINGHFDHTLCRCVPNICIHHVCPLSDSFDPVSCACVPNNR